MNALLSDLYFWVSFVMFVLSIAGIFWILNALNKDQAEFPDEGFRDAFRDLTPQPHAWLASQSIAADKLEQRLARIEEVLAKMDKKFNEQNADQMNEMAGQMKLMVQMLKTVQGGGGGESLALVNAKIDKMQQILSSLSKPEQK